jgi:hypothetical protein
MNAHLTLLDEPGDTDCEEKSGRHGEKRPASSELPPPGDGNDI